MPSALSDTEICNLALDYLDEAPLTDYSTDTSATARWFRRNFWAMAYQLMRKHPWNFAMARVQLPALSTAPAFGFAYAYQSPTDCLRVLPLTVDGNENSKPVRHKIEGQNILCDLPGPINVRYIRQVDNTGLFDIQFVNVLAIALGQKAAHFITGKASYAQSLSQIAQNAMLEAQMTDSLEGSPDEPDDTFWEEARG